MTTAIAGASGQLGRLIVQRLKAKTSTAAKAAGTKRIVYTSLQH